MAKPVLVTGFTPFGSHDVNISQQVAESLVGQEVRGHPIEVEILSVDETGSLLVANRINSGEQFAAIIHMGLAENADRPRIETVGRDILDFRIPDNSGRQIKDSTITTKGDLLATINPLDWDIERMIDSPIISTDAGEFLCNEVLHRTLATCGETPCFFLHFPLREKLSNPDGLALECIDRMLRPPAIDVGAGAIMQDGAFLAARRAPNEKHAGWWEFPGGKFEEGEDAYSCLRREIMEELELEVEVGGNIGIWIFDHGDVVVRLHVHECIVISGEMKLHVHDDSRWCTSPDEVPWLGPDYEIATAISAR